MLGNTLPSFGTGPHDFVALCPKGLHGTPIAALAAAQDEGIFIICHIRGQGVIWSKLGNSPCVQCNRLAMLSVLIWMPLLGMLGLAIGPADRRGWFRWVALGTTLAQLIWVLIAIMPAFLADMAHQAATYPGFRLVEAVPWIDMQLGSMGRLQLEYALGVDGPALLLVLLTAIIMPIAVISSWKIEHKLRSYFLLLMLLDTSLMGVFCAQDFFLFYLFYEFMLLPMFFLIGLWGGANREYAALKFFLYTLVGSVFMLLVMVGLLVSFTHPALSTAGEPVYTLNFTYLMQANDSGQLINLEQGSVFDIGQEIVGWNARTLAFLVLLIGFAIKLPAVPLHTWLPDAHVEAPTPISVILAGVVLKVGGYGIYRICFGLFPEGGVLYAPWIGAIGVISLVYGALVAMGQRDFKRLIAYSSVSHMGFVLLGFASLVEAGFNGSVYQLFTHGLISAMLFLIVGVIYDRTHDRQLDHYRGLWPLMPRYAVFTMIAFFASLGMPGFAAFIAELFVLMGSFQAATASSLSYLLPVGALLGIVLGAVYYLRTYRQLFFGQFDTGQTSVWRDRLTDITFREWLLLLPLTILILLFGLLPSLGLTLIDEDIAAFVHWIKQVNQASLPQS